MNSNRQDRKLTAGRHEERMRRLYGDYISRSIKGSVVYGLDAETPVQASDALSSPEVVFANTDTVSALFAYRSGKTAVLNFASYLNPGGGYLSGSFAQEEALCHKSTLYPVLSANGDYYDWNRKHKNRCLYTDRALYAPDIVFEDGDYVCDADVISCAAPNRRAAQTNCNVTGRENSGVLKRRAAFIRRIAEANHVETLVLGAYGCGVFGQDAEEVADVFSDVFVRTAVKRVVYAVPGSDRNAEAFRSKFEKGAELYYGQTT